VISEKENISMMANKQKPTNNYNHHNNKTVQNKKLSTYCELCQQAVKEVRCGRYGLLSK